MTKPNKDVIPSGSKAPGEGDKSGKGNGAGGEGAGNDDGKILGKFKTPEDMAASYQELETKLGEQKNEIGALRKKVEDAAAIPPADETKEPPKDFDAARTEIQDKIEGGEMSVPEGLKLLGDLTREQTAMELEQKFAEYDSERSAKEMYNSFINDNPDFLELDQSGALDAEINNNPMHDKFSAYFALKGQQQAEAAYEKGKEDALKLARGADGTRSVLSNPGSGAREAPKPQKGMGESEKVNGMLSALAASRQA